MEVLFHFVYILFFKLKLENDYYIIIKFMSAIPVNFRWSLGHEAISSWCFHARGKLIKYQF